MGRNLESIIYIDRGNRKIHNRSELEEKLLSKAAGGEVGETKIVLSSETDVRGGLGSSKPQRESKSEFTASDGGSQGDITLPALLSLQTLKYKKRFPKTLTP